MRARAEIDEHVVDAVARHDGTALLLDQLHLQRLAAILEEAHGLRFRQHPAVVGEVARRELLHLRFDGRQVLGHERPRDDEVIKEPVVGGRADAALGVREQRHHGGSHQVGRAVAVEVERLWIARRHEAQRRIGIEGERQIHERAVDDGREGGLRHARRQVRHQRAHRGPGGDFAAGSVRQCDSDVGHPGVQATREVGSAISSRISGRHPGSSTKLPLASRLTADGSGAERDRGGRHGRTRTADLLRVKQAL